MLDDGLEVLRRQLTTRDIAALIERTAKWVDAATFAYLPVWYPEDARRELMYKNNWSEPQFNTNRESGERIHKRTGNSTANRALSNALGVSPKNRPNWTCCHIWGIDDPSFQKSNAIVSDRRFYSCVANMVLLPTPFKAFTDAMPEIKRMLRVCAAFYYRWFPEHPEIPSDDSDRKRCDWDSYPASWPRQPGSAPSGVIEFSPVVKRYADARISKIRDQFMSAGEFYPRDEVRAVFEYWRRADLLEDLDARVGGY